jgi:hypothetical protein
VRRAYGAPYTFDLGGHVHLTRNTQEKCIMARIRRQNKLYQKNFTLKQYRTWKAAEIAAQKWVKKVLPSLPAAIPIKDRMTKRNTSGVVGVRVAESIRKKNGKEYRDWRWIAFWPGCPYSGGIGWSVNKYGDEQAFVYAFLARKFESTDRARIEREFLRIRDKKKYQKILDQKLTAIV